MGAPGMTSPIRTEAFKKLQLNAGIFLVDFDYSSYTSATAMKEAIKTALSDDDNILGVTRGGGSFTATREIRTPEVDGMRYPFKGADFVDSIDAFLSGTLLEVTPKNMDRLLSTGDSDTSGNKTTITMHTAIDPETDYIDSLSWVGDLANGSLVIITLKNAINTADFSLTFTDKGEGTMTFEFHARQDEVTDYDNAPFEIVFLDAPDVSVTVTPKLSEIPVEGTLQMRAKGIPSGGTTTWASDDTDVATVSAAGLVTGVAAGTVTITATYTPVSGSAVTDKAVVRVTAS